MKHHPREFDVSALKPLPDLPKLDVSHLQPLDVSHLQPLDVSHLQPLDVSHLREFEPSPVKGRQRRQEPSDPAAGGRTP